MNVQLRASVADFAFDAPQFERLRAGLRDGSLDRESARLADAPTALDTFEEGRRALHSPSGRETELRELGERAIHAGQVASLVLNGGMATRFGGGAKGAVPVVDGEPETFLSLKLQACARQASRCGGAIPVVVMNSFATRGASLDHLEAVGWGGVPSEDRLHFDQSIMPRLAADGSPLPDSDEYLDTDLYAAPGHGDTLGRLRESGVLAQLLDRGVEHILVSNVDNLGATVDPIIVGAQVEAARAGADVMVEVVRRQGDAGGCVAGVEGRPVIIEGFRLPASADLADYPHFNTNTLWFRATALDREFPLTWFPVQKRVALSDGQERAIVQFERLIGQVTEFLPSAYLEVDRDERFLPIKTRADLSSLEPRMRALIERARAPS